MKKSGKLVASGLVAAGVLLTGSVSFFSGAASADGPTCSDPSLGLNIGNHGTHIVGDYVAGFGGIGTGLSPSDFAGLVGAATGGNGGAAVPGGPGPGFHFPNSVPPGASFCNPQAQSQNAINNLP